MLVQLMNSRNIKFTTGRPKSNYQELSQTIKNQFLQTTENSHISMLEFTSRFATKAKLLKQQKKTPTPPLTDKAQQKAYIENTTFFLTSSPFRKPSMSGGSVAPSEDTGSWLCTLLLPPPVPKPTPRCSSSLLPLLLRAQLGVTGWELWPRWLCRLGRLPVCAPDRDQHRGLWVSLLPKSPLEPISTAGIWKLNTLPWLSRRAAWLALGPYTRPRRDWKPRGSKTERKA